MTEAGRQGIVRFRKSTPATGISSQRFGVARRSNAFEAQATATKEAQRAGIALARNDPRTYKGRKPSYTRAQFDKVVAMLNAGEGASAISADTGLTRQSILRIRQDRAGAEKALALWGL
ncbi:MAG: helix-turn-helix domain-containing protein [Rhizobiaceae bacterium]|nr:helix-turn-helix domain-containing protein [Rhizobiaceae bacterium]